MPWYHYPALAALLICIASLIFHAVRYLRLGNPEDFSRPSGKTGSAVRYSFTGAMSPVKKESAYMHLPTYTAGLCYHSGTFLSIAVFFALLFRAVPAGWMVWMLSAVLILSVFSGIGILVKRITLKKIRSFSNIDDYFSNMLVTLFQCMTFLVLTSEDFLPYFFISASMLLLYLPIGKLKHALYFFAARCQLGLFYGWRGIWPARKR